MVSSSILAARAVTRRDQSERTRAHLRFNIPRATQLVPIWTIASTRWHSRKIESTRCNETFSLVSSSIERAGGIPREFRKGNMPAGVKTGTGPTSKRPTYSSMERSPFTRTFRSLGRWQLSSSRRNLPAFARMRSELCSFCYRLMRKCESPACV